MNRKLKNDNVMPKSIHENQRGYVGVTHELGRTITIGIIKRRNREKGESVFEVHLVELLCVELKGLLQSLDLAIRC